MRYGELKKLLTKAGCYPTGKGTRHEQWYSPQTGRYFPVGRHSSEEVPTGTLKSILKAAGLK